MQTPRGPERIETEFDIFIDGMILAIVFCILIAALGIGTLAVEAVATWRSGHVTETWIDPKDPQE